MENNEKCVCGEPWTSGVIHRKDEPCYWPPRHSPAPTLETLEAENADKTARDQIGVDQRIAAALTVEPTQAISGWVDVESKLNWTEAFEKRFPLREVEGRINEDTWLGKVPSPQEIKSVIGNLLSLQRREMIERVQAKKAFSTTDVPEIIARHKGYNDGLDAALTILKEKEV